MSDLLSTTQGVTVGGDGCLSMFMLKEDDLKRWNLEPKLVHKVMKGHDTTAWSPEWADDYLLYPYLYNSKEDDWVPAFRCKHSNLADGLDFERTADAYETNLERKKGKIPEVLKAILEHRIDGTKLVAFPNVARYLLTHYPILSTRIMDKRNILAWHKQWYELHRPRDAKMLFSSAKIISPRLTPNVRFAIDEKCMALQDSCICLVPTNETQEEFDDFQEKLSAIADVSLRS